MPNVRRGKNMTGLVSYLAGPGTENEHTDPHLVAGSAPIMSWWDTATLSHQDALDIGRELTQPSRVYDTTIPAGYVWHTSLALHPTEGELGNEKWGQIATEFMRDMGFIDVEGKADVRWAAFHHGASKGGNDHIHLAVNLVRQDGTKADTYKDWPRAQKVARDLEKRHGLLQVVEGRGTMGVTPEQTHHAERRGRTEAERITVARTIRGAASGAHTEAEFIRRARDAGLILQPSFTDPELTQLRGYAAALEPPEGFAPTFYAGSKAARDLGLGELRKGWRDTEQNRAEAILEWRAAKYGRPVIGPKETAAERSPEDLAATGAVDELRKRMAEVPPQDHEEFRRLAHDLAGVYAAWSQDLEGPAAAHMERMADELAKSSQVSRDHYQRSSSVGPMGLRTATVLALAMSRGGPQSKLAAFTLVSHLTRQVYEHNRDRKDLIREESMKAAVAQDLRVVGSRLEKLAAAPSQPLAPELATHGPALGSSPVTGTHVPRATRERTMKESGAHLSR